MVCLKWQEVASAPQRHFWGKAGQQACLTGGRCGAQHARSPGPQACRWAPPAAPGSLCTAWGAWQDRHWEAAKGFNSRLAYSKRWGGQERGGGAGGNGANLQSTQLACSAAC